jgi:GH25 family lysozyme M1 (1,4-beta-N-acetylmuramidase)
MLVGNDISEFQKVDWSTYSKNSNFAIIRATYGVGYIDKQFVVNQDAVRNSFPMPHGFYHYAYPEYNRPEDEADWFLQTVNPQAGEILVLDFEEQYSGNPVAWCKVFLDHLSQHLDGYKPLIYLNQSQTENLDWSPVIDADYGLWVAAYTYDPTNNDAKIGGWPFAAMQQWTDKQNVPGISGNVDGDCFFGDDSVFGKYGFQPPVPQAPPASPQAPTPMQPTGNLGDSNSQNTTTPPPSTPVVTPPASDSQTSTPSTTPASSTDSTSLPSTPSTTETTTQQSNPSSVSETASNTNVTDVPMFVNQPAHSWIVTLVLNILKDLHLIN